MIHQRRNIDSFVLLYGVSGHLHLADGPHRHTLSPNDYLILAANRDHYGTAVSPPGLSYYWCHFYLQGDYHLDQGPDGKEILHWGKKQEIQMKMHGCFPNAAKMHLLFHQLIDSSRTASPFSKEICQNFLEIIMAEISAAISPAKSNIRQETTIFTILEWIRLNACQIRQVKEVADHFGYNSEYLTTLMKKATAHSLVYHINQSRVNYAKGLLRLTDDPIAQIAEQCGFTDEKYFSRVFKKHCDVSPGIFRKAYGKQHMNNQ